MSEDVTDLRSGDLAPRERRGDRSRRNVAVIVETSNDYARGILRGIHDFQREHPEWSVYLTEHGRHEPDGSFAGNWDGDGVIARIETTVMANIIRSMDVPTIDVSAARLIPELPYVETDDQTIAEQAVSHLADCGLRTIAFFGDPYYNWSRLRYQAYLRIIERLQLEPHSYMLPVRTDPQVRWYDQRDSIRSWLQKLPKPAGIFACYDACAQQLLEICRYYGILVPEDVAVVGVDDDELLCELSSPPLSSVILNSRRTGYVAASLLHQMMNGIPVDRRKYAIASLGVRKRVSTDILAVEDALVAQAIAFIRDNSQHNLTVDDVVHSVPLSRRALETRFKNAVNRTPHQEITRVRANAIRELLYVSDMTLSELAEILSFEHPEYLSVFFKKETGMTPKQYRDEARRHRSLRPEHPVS
jgi:LacI family transcriptional regulator